MPRGTVVIAEDHGDLRFTLRELLEQEGYCALEARDGKEALRLLAETPLPCLLILDLMMPKLSGWDVLRALPDTGKRVPVIVTSAFEGDWMDEVRRFDSVVATMRKPPDVNALVALVETHCPPLEVSQAVREG